MWGDAKVPFEQVTGYGLAEIDAVLNKLSNNPNGVVSVNSFYNRTTGTAYQTLTNWRIGSLD